MVSVRSFFTRLEAPDLVSVLTEEVCGQLAQSIGESVYYRWVQLAKTLPRAQQKDYLAGIQQVVLNGSVATVALLGDEANAIENGSPGLDLRTVLLGPGVPIVPPRQGLRGKHEGKRGGYYRAIPFRHQGPKSQSTFGAALGSAYRSSTGAAQARKLGKALYAAAKALAPSTTEPFRVTGGGALNHAPKKPGTRWGGRLAAGFMNIKPLKLHHKTDPYAGMVNMEKTYENATQSVLMTFRTISTANPAGWHTGASDGKNLMGFIESELPEMGKKVLDLFVQGFRSPESGAGQAEEEP